MKSALRPHSKLLRLLGILTFGGGCLFYLTAIVLAGGSLAEALLFWAAFVICLLGSGLFLVRHLLPATHGVERLILAFLPGCTAVFGGYVLIGLIPGLNTFGPLHLLPSALLGGYELFFLWRSRRPVLLPPCMTGRSRPLFWGTVGLLLAMYALWGVLPFAEAEQLKAWTYNQDMLWSIGNAASMRFGMPLQDLRAAGLTLNYHFFNDGIAGILAWGTGCSAWDGLCFYWYGPILVLSIAALACVGQRLADLPWLPLCIAPILYLCNPGRSTMAINLFTNANAQGSALLAIGSLLLLLQNAPAEKARKTLLGYGLLAFLSFTSACMIKSPMGALMTLAVTAACIVGAVTRQTQPAHLAALAGGVAAFGCVYALVLCRATNNLVFTTLANLTLLPNAYLLYFTLPVLILYAVGLVHSLRRFAALDIPLLTANALAVGGMLAYVLFSHYSFSQVYFALAAVPCAVISAIPAVCHLVHHPARSTGLRTVGAVLSIAAFTLCFALQLYGNQSSLRSGVQAALRCLDLRESQASELTVTDEDWAAALWLRENTAPDSIFISNRNNRQFDAADGIFHFFSAASQRRGYLESYRYGMDYDGAYHEIRRRLETVSDAIYYQLPEEEAFALASAEGVDYLIESLLVPNAPSWKTTPVYENQYVRIYAVNR